MKPIKGIIKNWRIDLTTSIPSIRGTCVVHTDEGSEGSNVIIVTSRVLNIVSINGTILAETQNSTYILV